MKGRGIIIQKRRHNARDSSNNKASDNVFFLIHSHSYSFINRVYTHVHPFNVLVNTLSHSTKVSAKE